MEVSSLIGTYGYWEVKKLQPYPTTSQWTTERQNGDVWQQEGSEMRPEHEGASTTHGWPLDVASLTVPIVREQNAEGNDVHADQMAFSDAHEHQIMDSSSRYVSFISLKHISYPS